MIAESTDRRADLDALLTLFIDVLGEDVVRAKLNGTRPALVALQPRTPDGTKFAKSDPFTPDGVKLPEGVQFSDRTAGNGKGLIRGSIRAWGAHATISLPRGEESDEALIDGVLAVKRVMEDVRDGLNAVPPRHRRRAQLCLARLLNKVPVPPDAYKGKVSHDDDE